MNRESKESEIRELLGELAQGNNKKTIDELFGVLGVSNDFLMNPNNSLIPYKVEKMIYALAQSHPFVQIDNDGTITIRGTGCVTEYYAGESYNGNITLSVKDGELFIDFYHSDSLDNKNTVEHYETAIGKYSDGTKVVRTLNGSYSVKRDAREGGYAGNGFYEFREFNADGVQMGLTGVGINNNLNNSFSLGESQLIAQDRYLRVYGLHGVEKISAHMQRDIPPLSDSPFISHVYTYYRDESDIEKLHVIEKESGKSSKSGYDFAFGGEHGSDNILRNGVGTLNMMSMEEYEDRRSSFYINGDIDEEKRKSPLSSKLIDDAYEKFNSSSKNY